MKFTPGPWETREGQIYNESGKTHCLIPYWNSGEQEESTARLIAAAPELLSALQEQHSVICNILTDSQLDERLECGRTIREYLETTRAAIRKATEG